VKIEKELVKNNLRLPGQFFDEETGLYYNWHRYYSPETGRYISADPIGFRGGINLYAYVGGDPVNGVDAWGLAKCTYSISKHELVCVSNTADDPLFIGPDEQRQIGPNGVWSGVGPCTNDPECVNNNDIGPIVPRNYKMNQDNRPGHEGFWRLEPDPKISGWKCRLGLERCGFELHPGSISLGCITADKKNPSTMDQYKGINDLLQRENGNNQMTVVP
jgi:RHS repeat-associated protein